MGLFLGFGRLGQDPFGEKQVFAEIGQHLEDMGIVLGKLVVQFFGQRVHVTFLLGMITLMDVSSIVTVYCRRTCDSTVLIALCQ